MKDSKQIDRVSRLGVTLTILGVIWYVLLKALDLLLTIFSQKLYLNSIYSSEHFIALVFVCVFVSILVSGVKYVYSELKTLKQFDDESLFLEAKKVANNNFNDIFVMLKVNLTLIILSIVFVIILETTLFNSNVFLKGVYVTFVIAIIILLIIRDTRRNFIAFSKKLYSFVKLRMKQLSSWFYILFLLIILAFSSTVLSSNYGQTIEVNFQDESSLPIDIEFTNFEIENIKIYLFELKGDNGVLINDITIPRKDFYESSYSVLETSSKHLLSSNEDKEAIASFDFRKQQTVLRKRFELINYISSPLYDGKYRIKIVVENKYNLDSKKFELVNDFLVEGNKSIFNKNEFVIEL
ncbi:hypothetical protein GMD78_12945 [Ornithinibacillus sp. L9]|uniref:Uncharacterized protein n=1 Tax=Ornithinibacillus caprae TaxID=2678566 RepID=A0A6N8FNC4_9BACI|nr:hypothetical protein [Ornithinibacillus caprae]MUK89279.1 hypothetical protein [Ornithinibacillus caprae]